MSQPLPARLRLSRRTTLALTAAVGLGAAGCTGNSRAGKRQQQGNAPAEEAPRDPDVAVATEALAAVEHVLAFTVAARSRHGQLAELLDATVDVHDAHGALLVGAVPPGARPSVSPSPSADATSSPTAGRDDGAPEESPAPRVEVPRSPARTLARLVEEERSLTATCKRLAFAAESGAFARALGSMAAAAAQQATVLAEAPASRARSGGGRR